MALLLQNESFLGVIVQNIYVRIEMLYGSKNTLGIDAHYYIYENNTVSNNKIKVKSFTFAPSVDDASANFIKQGYDYMKVLPEFKNAIDLLE